MGVAGEAHQPALEWGLEIPAPTPKERRMDKVVKITVKKDDKDAEVVVTELNNGGCLTSYQGKVGYYSSVYEAGGELLTDILR